MEHHDNFSLKEYNTFGIDVLANKFFIAKNVEDLSSIVSEYDPPFFVLGGGSNILLTKNMSANVIYNQIKGIEKIEESDDSVIVEIGAGEVWDEFVHWAVEEGLGGVENLALIPGSVGAAPIQNIGAYGVELKDVFHSLTAISLEDGHHKIFEANDCAFAYRNSVFKNTLKGEYCITKVRLILQKIPILNLSYGAIKQELDLKKIESPSIKDVSEVVKSIRRSKLPDPKVIGNSGSFFKNPVVSKKEFESLKEDFPEIKYYAQDDGTYKIPAGWLIDSIGWKGKKVGHTGCYEKQALVIVNYGDATGIEIQQHAMNVRTSVYSHYGILLEPEVNIL